MRLNITPSPVLNPVAEGYRMALLLCKSARQAMSPGAACHAIPGV